LRTQQLDGKWLDMRAVKRLLQLPVQLKMRSTSLEYQEATAFAVVAIRQCIEFFHLLGDAHDRASLWLTDPRLIYEARALLDKYQGQHDSDLEPEDRLVPSEDAYNNSNRSGPARDESTSGSVSESAATNGDMVEPPSSLGSPAEAGMTALGDMSGQSLSFTQFAISTSTTGALEDDEAAKKKSAEEGSDTLAALSSTGEGAPSTPSSPSGSRASSPASAAMFAERLNAVTPQVRFC
jgi:hypothetical protein